MLSTACIDRTGLLSVGRSTTAMVDWDWSPPSLCAHDTWYKIKAVEPAASSSSMVQAQSFVVVEEEELMDHSRPMKKPCFVDHDPSPMQCMLHAGSEERSRSQDPLFKKQQRIYISDDAQHGAIKTRLAGLCQPSLWSVTGCQVSPPSQLCLARCMNRCGRNRTRCRALWRWLDAKRRVEGGSVVNSTYKRKCQSTGKVKWLRDNDNYSSAITSC